MQSNSTRPAVPGKPAKPTPDFPLTPHANGKWCKKIAGKVRYFGPWHDPDGALRRYREFLDNRETDNRETTGLSAAVEKPRSRAGVGCNVRLKSAIRPRVVVKFVDKLLEHVSAGDVSQAILLVNNASETRCFQAAAWMLPPSVFLLGGSGFWTQPADPESRCKARWIMFRLTIGGGPLR